MILDRLKVYNALKEKGVTYLYHSNTVTTSCTFLEEGGLLSRGAVEASGFEQTAQQTDVKDKELGIWNDIFFDCCDIHSRSRRRNFYGPVLFKFDITILLDENLPPISITKSNPQYWESSLSNKNRYFESIDELKTHYNYRDFGKSLTLRNTDEILPFNPYLKEIVVDNPNRKISGNDVYESAINTLKLAARRGETVHPDLISERVCFDCNCDALYQEMSQRALRHFFY